MAVIPDRRSIRSEQFWGRVAPCEHLLQIYGNDNIFLDTLEGFAGSGLRGDEGVIVIATARTIHELEKRLRARWIDIDRARWQRRYIAVTAKETLARFMVNDWPDEELFNETILGLVGRVRGDGRKVRAFGEMVALLWARNPAATLRLELLWSKLCESHDLALFCAYPRSVFEGGSASSSASLCAAHTQLLPG
jgi:hypothetical protein